MIDCELLLISWCQLEGHNQQTWNQYNNLGYVYIRLCSLIKTLNSIAVFISFIPDMLVYIAKAQKKKAKKKRKKIILLVSKCNIIIR